MMNSCFISPSFTPTASPTDALSSKSKFPTDLLNAEPKENVLPESERLRDKKPPDFFVELADLLSRNTNRLFARVKSTWTSAL